MRKLSLLARFSILSLVFFALIGAWLGYNLTNFFQDQALLQQEVVLSDLVAPLVSANVTDAVLTSSAYPPPPGTSRQDEENYPYTLLHRALSNLSGAGLVRVKIWNKDGVVIYSDDTTLIGKHFDVDEDLQAAFNGKASADLSTLDKPENAEERSFGQLLEVYTPLRMPWQTPIVGAVEGYYTVTDLQGRIGRTNFFLWSSIIAGFLILYVSLFTIVRNASRRMLKQSNENLALLADTERKAARLAAVNDLSRSINRSSLDLDAVFNTGLRGIDRITQHSGASITLFDEEAGHPLRTITSTQPDSIQPSSEEIEGEMALIAGNSTVIIGDTGAGTEQVLKILADKGLRSLIVVPISLGERRLGMLRVVSRTPKAFTEDDVFILESVVDQLAVALENTRLIAETAETTALRETNRLKDDFVSMVSHELRTPLASIKGYSRTLLTQKGWDDATTQEFLHVISDESDKLQDLVENLLEIARIEAGRLPIATEPVLLSHFCREVVTRITNQYPDMHFECEMPDNLPAVEADPRRIEQVLSNLLQNAAKYSGGEQVAVAATHPPGTGEVVVSVRDNGVGIAPEHLPHLFDKFYRAQWNGPESGSGTGLGLAIARALVEAQGGRIWVESQPGKGTTFYFTLPALLISEAEPAYYAPEPEITASR